ncbi:DUF4265 domain-containing protein [Hymenobacter daecheongensis]|uniref:DUF4265 domain-containing protein n=1 Tax=Hymenobacter daecheongensis TaxID=496053 RepID=UPI000935495C|nr:DUF4265 domain-containing protein [Hymenobacter daecheongensis]
MLDEDYTESLWAQVVNAEEGKYRLDNIPFFVKSYALADIVYAQLQNEELVVQGLVAESGNSTLQIIFFKEKLIHQVQNKLESMGCDWEGSHLPDYFSVNIPKQLVYKPIERYLQELEKQEVLSYREACLAHGSS